jgi:short subunit dehydrogenase-like uncharacterized protein
MAVNLSSRGLLNGTILIYGATGYTERLIAKATDRGECARSWSDAILIKVKRVAQPLDLSARAVDLGDPRQRRLIATVHAALGEVARETNG